MKTVSQAAHMVAAEDGEMAPSSLLLASKTIELGEAIPMISPGTTAPTIADPRTGEPWSQSSVYVVTMDGRFTASRHIPDGHPVPTGSHLSLAIDVASGRVVSQFLGRVPPALPEPAVTQ
jgi:hypothetical protein